MSKTLVVHVGGCTVQSSLLREQNLQKPLQIPKFELSKLTQVEVDSFLSACLFLENWIKSLRKK